jgi:hypothetical protein
MLQVDSANYSASEASNLQNVEFFYANGNIIPSWLESGNSNTATNTIYWLSLSGGIAAGSSVTVFMGFAAPSVNLLNAQTTGEAPQLSTSYGQYDDGANVFTLYDNFAGTSYNTAKWSPSTTQCAGGPGSVNNGDIMPADDCVDSVQAFTSGIVLDAYASLTANPTGLGFEGYDFIGPAGIGYEAGAPAPGPYPNSFGLWEPTTRSFVGFPSQPPSGSDLVWTMIINQSMLSAEYGYSNQISLPNPSPSSSSEIGIFSGFYVGMTMYTQWIRIRAGPPNGVMPRTTFGLSVVATIATTTTTATVTATTTTTTTATLTTTTTTTASATTTTLTSFATTSSDLIPAFIIGFSIVIAGCLITIGIVRHPKNRTTMNT